jgi:mannitol-1-phosphate/altronate dehydrogenase
VESFEAIKGRLLNASHMPLAYPAALTGYRWVSEAANDPAIAQLLNTFMVVDAGALLDAPADVSLADYQAVVVGRFAKPPRARYRAAGRARRRRQAPSAPHATAEGPLAIGGDVRREALLLATFRRCTAGIDDHGEQVEVLEPHLADREWPLLHSDNALDFQGVPGNRHILQTEGVHAAVR